LCAPASSSAALCACAPFVGAAEAGVKVRTVEKTYSIAGATGEETIWRVRLRVTEKLPARFDVTPPAFEIALNKYPMRTWLDARFQESNQLKFHGCYDQHG
jgi:predicted secreted Zn-dependent protease